MKFSLNETIVLKNGLQGQINFIGYTSLGDGIWLGINIENERVDSISNAHNFLGMIVHESGVRDNPDLKSSVTYN